MWLITGLVVGALIISLIWWLNNKSFCLKWYEWLLVAVGLLLLLFTFQNFFGSFGEQEPEAAWKFLLVTGLPSLILLGIATVLSVMRLRKNEK